MLSKLSPYLKRVFLPVHLLGLISIIVLVTQFAWWVIPAIWLGWLLTGCIGTEVALHRLYAHNAFTVRSSPLKWVLGWAACMGGQWSPIFWTALHRGYHHPGCDTARDIHSPVHGKWSAFAGWMFKLKDSDVRLSYAGKMIRDPMHLFYHRRYVEVFWATLGACYLLFGAKLFFLIVVPAILLAMHQENIVNLLCHLRSLGYRNFDTKDDSVNIYVLGLLLWGQGFHNNHHAKPNRYDFGETAWEIDLCRWVVPTLLWIDSRLHSK